MIIEGFIVSALTVGGLNGVNGVYTAKASPFKVSTLAIVALSIRIR